MLGSPNCHHFTRSIFIFLVVIPSQSFCVLYSWALIVLWQLLCFVSEKSKGELFLAFCRSDCSFLFSVGLKTYLISGQKVKEPHCSCSQTLLPGLESGDGARIQGASSAENASDLTKTLKHAEKPKVSSCFKAKQHRSQTVQLRDRCMDGWGNLTALFMHCSRDLHVCVCIGVSIYI